MVLERGSAHFFFFRMGAPPTALRRNTTFEPPSESPLGPARSELAAASSLLPAEFDGFVGEDSVLSPSLVDIFVRSESNRRSSKFLLFNRRKHADKLLLEGHHSVLLFVTNHHWRMTLPSSCFLFSVTSSSPNSDRQASSTTGKVIKVLECS